MRWVPLCSCLLLAACPGDDGSADATVSSEGSVTDSTSSSATDSDSATSSVTSSATDTTSATTTTTADSSSGGDMLCPAFEDARTPTIAIEITNMRPEGVWLPLTNDCIEPVPFAVHDPADAPLDWRPPPCGTCEGAVQGQCPCPPPFCDEATGLFIEPGATVQYTWNGAMYVEQTVPPECPGIDECGASCGQATIPPAGAYSISIEAGGASGCASEPCACTPADGSCTLLDRGMTFEGLVEIEVALELPGGSAAMLVIE